MHKPVVRTLKEHQEIIVEWVDEGFYEGQWMPLNPLHADLGRMVFKRVRSLKRLEEIRADMTGKIIVWYIYEAELLETE